MRIPGKTGKTAKLQLKVHFLPGKIAAKRGRADDGIVESAPSMCLGTVFRGFCMRGGDVGITDTIYAGRWWGMA